MIFKYQYFYNCKGKTPPHECPGYDTKQFDGEIPVILEL